VNALLPNGCKLKYVWFICLCVYLNHVRTEIIVLFRTSNLFMMGHFELMCQLIDARVTLLDLFHTKDFTIVLPFGC
jgi:hypothetical protein